MAEYLHDGADPTKPMPADGIDSLAFLDYPELVYEDGLPSFTEEEWAAISRGETFTYEELVARAAARKAAMRKPG